MSNSMSNSKINAYVVGQWRTDTPPPMHLDHQQRHVQCLDCGQGGLVWAKAKLRDWGANPWGLYEVGPWYMGSRYTLHQCPPDYLDEGN